MGRFSYNKEERPTLTCEPLLFGGRKRTRTADLLRVNYDDNFLWLLVHYKKWLYCYAFCI